jgi:hypothetical protein
VLTESSLCELVLAAACAWGVARALAVTRIFAALGFGLLGAAAIAGAIEYAGLAQAAPTHQLITRAVTWLSVALIALDRTLYARALACLAVVGLLVLPAPLAYVVNAAAFGSLAVSSGSAPPHVRVAVLAGIVLFVAAALAVGPTGQIAGWPRLDLYHLMLAVAVVLISSIFRRPESSTTAKAMVDAVA